MPLNFVTCLLRILLRELYTLAPKSTTSVEASCRRLIKTPGPAPSFNAFFPELGSLLRNTVAKRTAHEYDFELPVDTHFRLCIKIQCKQDKIQRNTQRTKPNFSFTSKSWAIILRSEHVDMKETSEKLLKIIITLSGTQLVLKQQDYLRHPISIIISNWHWTWQRLCK